MHPKKLPSSTPLQHSTFPISACQSSSSQLCKAGDQYMLKRYLFVGHTLLQSERANRDWSSRFVPAQPHSHKFRCCSYISHVCSAAISMSTAFCGSMRLPIIFSAVLGRSASGTLQWFHACSCLGTNRGSTGSTQVVSSSGHVNHERHVQKVRNRSRAGIYGCSI